MQIFALAYVPQLGLSRSAPNQELANALRGQWLTHYQLISLCSLP